ncbi:MAG: hypothetical protein Q9168_005896 [Polycauliona sp. 1 TL-2023]
MAPSTIPLSCACGSITATVSVPSNQSLPLPFEFCHCASCRHSSGQLAISCFTCPRSPSSDGAPTLQITFKEQPVAYKSSEQMIRYFCGKCGASLWLHAPESGDWEICTGVLDKGEEGGGGDEVLKFKQHIFVEDTKDGGMSAWIEGPRWKGWGQKSEVFSLPEVGSADEKRENSEQQVGKSEKRKLQCNCHCRGVEFFITPPDEEQDSKDVISNHLFFKSFTTDTQPSQSQTLPPDSDKDDEKWYLSASGTKYLAGLCACDSCRLATGYDLQAWVYVPKHSIRRQHSNGEEKEIDFNNLGTLKTYSHTPRHYRDFCGTCGATVFWRADRRGNIIDVSAGLLDAEEGARAERWLEWRNTVSFEEDAINKGLLAKVKEGLKGWGGK